MNNKSTATILSKVYAEFAKRDLYVGFGDLSASYEYSTGKLVISVVRERYTLTVTDNPDGFVMNGRKNWRAIRALVDKVQAKSDEWQEEFVNDELVNGAEEFDDGVVRGEMLDGSEPGFWLEVSGFVRPENQEQYDRFVRIHESITLTEWEAARVRIWQRMAQNEVDVAERVRNWRASNGSADGVE